MQRYNHPMTQSRAPLIVAIALLLPVLYVGSYLPLMDHERFVYSLRDDWFLVPNYRFGGQYTHRFFWPLLQLDRKLRPRVWGLDLDQRFLPSSGAIERYVPASP
jgi:hypothetical protein